MIDEADRDGDGLINDVSERAPIFMHFRPLLIWMTKMWLLCCTGGILQSDEEAWHEPTRRLGFRFGLMPAPRVAASLLTAHF